MKRRRILIMVHPDLVPPEDIDGRTMIDYLSFRIVYPADGWPKKVRFVWDDFEGASFMDESTIPGTLRVGPQIETCAFAEEEARAKKPGLWIDKNPIPPWGRPRQ